MNKMHLLIFVRRVLWRKYLMNFLLPLILIAGPLQLHAQERSIDNALLWKVTGNHLVKPSFLFGTIHLQDQRVFNFNDSLYSFIKAADGFAMEIHPDSVISALMQKAEETTPDKLLSQHLSKDEFAQLSRKLRKELGIDANKLTLKEAYLLKDHLGKPAPRADDMPTFVDAYLFGMARNQGKEIVGLEKATDQVNLLEDLKGNVDVKELLKNLKNEKSITERLVQLYIKEDLQAIHNLMSYLPAETEDKLLNMRNSLMVLKMDSLIQSKSFVVAVGTAHLPGKKGMIELLRQKGYTVEPVFTTSRTHANNYAIKAAQKYVWVDVKEPQLGYTVRMPGKPSPMEMLNGSMKMNMYMDLSSMKLYYTAFVVPAISVTKKNADSVLQAMCTNAMASSKGQPISRKRFVKGEFEGIDFVYRQTTDKMYARVQALVLSKRIYLVGFGSAKQEDLAAPESENFFSSFVLQDMPVNAWEVQSFKGFFFTISLPSQAKVVDLTGNDSSVRSVQINSMENNSGSYYGLTIATANAGFVVPDDSAYFSNWVERFGDNMVIYELQQKDTTFNGFNARRIHARLKDDLQLNCMMISRGNRIYNLTAITGMEDSVRKTINAFFDSFSFTDYPKLQWQQKQESEFDFTVPVVSQSRKIHYFDTDEDSAVTSREYQWLTYDSVSATTFYITHRVLSPYLWVKHDSVLLKKYMRDLTNPNEILIDYRFVRNGNSNGIEFNIRKKNTSLLQRIRVLLNGNAVYIMQADVPYQYWNANSYQQFMEGFRFIKEARPDFLYTNSFKKFLADLSSTDSAIYSRASSAIEDLIFDSTDIPALLQAALVKYPLDTMEYYGAAHRLMNVLASMKHPAVAELVADHYSVLTPLQEQFKYGLLQVLARQRTDRSYALIEKLLRQGLPSKGNPNEFIAGMSDSLLLTKKLYPYLLTLSEDTLLGAPLFYLHQKMIDSNLISVDQLKAYRPLLLKAAKNELLRIAVDKEDFYYTYGVYGMLHVLKSLHTDSSIAMLRKFMNARQVNIKDAASILLLKMQQPVNAATLQTIAADKGFRASLYQDLKDMQQEKLFPAKYFNQKSFAESYFQNALEEDEPYKVQLIGERTVVFNGKKQKFFLYKATLTYDGDKQIAHLGISGAFNPDGKQVPIEDDVSGIYWEEEFSQSQIEKQLRAYLSNYEKMEND